MPISKEDLHEYGRYLYGNRYQSPLAAALTAVRGRSVTQAQISQWVSKPDGQREPPEWLHPLILRVAHHRRMEMLGDAEWIGMMIQRDVAAGVPFDRMRIEWAIPPQRVPDQNGPESQ